MAKEQAPGPSPEKPKRGFLAYLPWILAILILAAGGWVTFKFMAKKSPEAGGEAAEGEGGEAGHGKERAPKAPPRLAVPLVPDKVVFVPRLHAGDSGADMIVSTNLRALKKVIVPLADKKAPRYAMAQIFLASDNTDELIKKVNANQPELFEKISNRIKDKTAKDILTPGFRSRIRAELLYECNRLLGSNVVQEIIIAEFLTQ